VLQLLVGATGSWREERADGEWRITVIPRRDAPLIMWLVVAPFDAFVIYGVHAENPVHPTPAPLYWAFVVGAILLTCIAVSNAWGRVVLTLGPGGLRRRSLPFFIGSYTHPLHLIDRFELQWREANPNIRRDFATGTVVAVSWRGERKVVQYYDERSHAEHACQRLNAMLRELRPPRSGSQDEPYR
jgi:hypothetical protein